MYGQINTSFKMHFFVLHRHFRAINYYESQHAYKHHFLPKGVVLCNERSHVSNDPDSPSEGGRAFLFTIKDATGRELKCMTDSEEQRHVWVSGIQAAIQRQNPGMAPISPPSGPRRTTSLRETLDREHKKVKNDPYIWQQWRKAILQDKDMLRMRDPRLATRYLYIVTHTHTHTHTHTQGISI